MGIVGMVVVGMVVLNGRDDDHGMVHTHGLHVAERTV